MASAGRPRSEVSRCRILETALRLARTVGYARLTMDGIAAEAGVGKQTIYRWWPSKASVVLEALRENARVEIEVPDTGSLRDDLASFFRSTFATAKRRPGLDRVLRAMMAEAQHDQELAVTVKNELIEPRRAVLRSLLTRAKRRGEVPSLRDIELRIDLAFGVFWYRLLADLGPLDDGLARKLAGILSRPDLG